MLKIRRPSPFRFITGHYWIVGALLGFLLTPGTASAGRQLLYGHVPKAVGQLPSVRRLATTNVLQLAIGLPLRHQDELTNLLQDLYDPASPNYRHFLSAAEFAQRFGPTEADYEAVMAFAKTNGLQVVGTHPNRVVLDVAGAVPDIERTFHLNLRVYPHPTEAREFYAPDAEPQLDLAAPVLHISGLDNFLVPQPLCRELSAVATPAGTPAPAPAAGSGPSGNYAGKDFRAAYAPGVTNTGAGQAVGLLEFQGYFAADIQNYETTYSLPNIPLNNVLLGGLASITTDAGDAECPLDIEMAIAMATNLSQVIIYCTTRSGNTDDMLNRMATDNLAKQLSASWIIGADATGRQIQQQFAAQGQSYFNASGDSDAASAAVPLGEDSPYITTVGGTTLVTIGAGGPRASEATWNRGNGTGSTGGISPTYAIPLWQQGINMDVNQGSSFMRNVPDVAMVAENVWVLYNNGGSGAFGGTSCAAPLWAGFMALVNQQAAANGRPPIGFINPAIYAIGKSSSYTTDFHDVTTGNNTLPSSPSRFSAFPGYDLCTGWGSPSGQNLINALVAGTGDPLLITPTNGLATAGPAGGAFVPASGTFTLANFAGTTNRWSLINTSAWLTVTPASGTLLSGASATVTVNVAAAANSLPAGYYSATLLFSNQTTAAVQSRLLSLVVGTGLTWDSSAGGGAPQDGPGTWADQSSANGNTNWFDGGADGPWNNALPEIATFGAGTGAGDVVTLGSAVTAAGINFKAPGSGNYTIADGGNTLTLNGNVTASVSATIAAPVTLGLPATFSVANAQTLTVSGVLSGGISNTLTITGPGTVSLTGQNNTSAAAGLAGNIALNSGTLALNGSSLYGTLGNVAGITVGAGATLSLAGINALSGTSGTARSLTVNGGTITNGGSGNQALGLLTFNGGTLAGAGSSTAGSFNLNGDVFVYANTTFTAPNLTTTSGSAFKVAGGQSLTLAGPVIGTGGLTCNGSGTVILATNNTYSGSTTVSYGTLRLLTAGGLGTGTGTSVGSGGQLQISASLTNTRPLTLNGVGAAGGGALHLSSGANAIWTGAITLGSPAMINLDSGTALGLSNTISGSYGLTLAGGTGSQGVLSGALANGTGGLSKSGAGTWILSGANSFTGTLNVDTASTTASDGILRFAPATTSLASLAGVNILNNNSGTSTLQLDGTAGSFTLAAPLFNVNCRNNTVPTIENLNGTNTIRGVIALNVGGNMFNIQADAGRLIFSGTNQYVGSLTGGRIYVFSGAGEVLLASPILNSTNGAPISLTKSGTGTLTLAGTNTYGNGTTLSGGTLLVNGAISGALSLASATTLGGNGIIFSSVTLPPGATLAPGTNGTANGTLTVSNTLTLQAGSFTRLKISQSPSANNGLRVAGAPGSLTYGGTLTVSNLAGALTAGNSFKLFNAASYAGSFTASNLPPLGSGLAWNTHGLTNGTISVVATVSPQFSSIAPTDDGNFQMNGSGAAGVTYQLQSTTNLTPPVVWNFVTNAVADQTGQFQFADLQATNFPQQFYRIASPF